MPRHTLAIGITNRCPLRCAFCCVPPGPGDISRSLIDQLIDEVLAQPSSWKGVGFTGGEPLLRIDDVCRLGARLKSASVPWGVTTGLGWVANTNRAISVANRLIDAGISRLNISFDPSHYKELRRDHHKSFVSILIQHDIDIVVSCTTFIDESMNDSEILNGLGIDDASKIKIERHYVAKAGYAKGSTNCSQNKLNLNNSKCPLSDGLTLSVWPEGDVYPCCSTYTVNKDSGLIVGNVNNETLTEIVSRVENDLFFSLIRQQGFAALIGFLGHEIASLKEIFSDHPHDVCHLCSKLDQLEGIGNIRDMLLEKSQKLCQAV